MDNLYQSPTTSPFQPSDNSTMGMDGTSCRCRPGGLTAICVIAIVLGAMGLGGSLLGLASLALQSSLQKAFTMPQQPGMPKDFAKAQSEMQEKIQAVNKRYWGVNVGLTLTNLVLATCLLTGAIMTMRWNPKACTFLASLFTVIIAFEVVRTVVMGFATLDMATAMSDAMSHMMAASGPKNGPGANQAVAFGAKVGVFAGMAVAVVFAIAKMTFYGIGFCYLRRPNVCQLFQRNTTA